MKIRQVHIDGFGVWRNLQLNELPESVTVVYGPNEAGKSTLMQFLRSALYGYTPLRRQRYFPPFHGGKPGGSIAIDSALGQYHIARQPGTDGVDTLRIAGKDGVVHGQELMGTLLHGLDETTFANVFAIGLREIQELNTLSDTAAADLLYRLTTGLDRVSLSDVLRELAATRQDLLDSQGGASRIGQLVEQRQRLNRDITGLREQSAGYTHLMGEREAIDQELAECERSSSELKLTAQRLELALGVFEPWQQRAALLARCEELGPVEPVPDGSVQRLDELKGQITAHRARVTELKAERQQTRLDATSIKVNRDLWRQAPYIEALALQQGWIRDLEKQVQQDNVDVAAFERKLQEQLDKLPPTKARHDDLAQRQRIVNKLREPASLVRDARRRLGEAKEAVSDRQSSATRLDETVRTAVAGKPSDLAGSLDRAGSLVSQLRRRVQLDEKLSKMKQQEAEVDGQIRELLDRQIMPAGVLVGLGGVFMFGMALILAGLLLPSLGHAGWTLAFLGGLGATVAGGGKIVWERVAAQQLEAGQRQMRMLQGQIEGAKQERDQLDAQLPKGGGPLLTRLQTAERELAQLEETVGVDTKRKAAESDLSSAEDRLRVAKIDHRSALRRWEDSLHHLGLPRKLSPKQVSRYVRQFEAAGEGRQQLERLRKERQQRRDQLQPIIERIDNLAKESKVPLKTSSPADRLTELHDALQRQAQRVAQRRELRKQWRLLGRQLDKAEHALRAGLRDRAELLEAANAEDEAEVRHRAALSAELARLHSQIDALSDQVNIGLGLYADDLQVHKWLDELNQKRLTAHRDDVIRRQQSIEEQIRSLHERRGQLTEQLRQLAGDCRLADRLLELSIVDKKIEEALERWQLMAVGQRLLEAIRHKYEKERQPQTLQQASLYLARMTEGQYVRIWTPIDDDVLRVDDAEGRCLPVEVLSRGTREQLFLALRLALVSSFTRRGIHLPLVLDDVLVNFDLRRANTTAKVLCQFAAEGHQILLFTCHEHIVRVFTNIDVLALVLPDNKAGGVAEPMYLPKLVVEQEALPAVDELELEPMAPEPENEDEELLELADELELAEPEPCIQPLMRCAAPQPLGAVAVEEHPGRTADEVLLRPVIRRILGPFANAVWQEPVSVPVLAEARRDTYEEQPLYEDVDWDAIPDDLPPRGPRGDKPRRKKSGDVEAA